MIDRDRILTRIDQLDSYLSELRQVAPADLETYRKIEKKRSCERLLQISIECVVDICGSIVAGLHLGLPQDEEDLFEKLDRASVISTQLKDTLRRMKGLRNILVHEYGAVDDEAVFDVVQNRLGDFEAIKREILKAVR
jgi:uncharacterized protein YutE (UPF0331/DUF86 family)